VVLRLAYEPHLIPGGLLPRRHLRRLSGIFPHVADREPLDLDLLLRVLLSLPLSIFGFGRLGKFSHGELQPGVFDATSVRAAGRLEPVLYSQRRGVRPFTSASELLSRRGTFPAPPR
jgi:hypothetical protein